MEEMIEIQWTSGSIDEARRVSRYLVQERLVASAQIIPWVESIVLLDGRLDTNQESKVILKSLKRYFDKIKGIILENSRYEIPEVSYYLIDGLNSSYEKWLSESITR